jgi:prepilin-type N-terminal cleavage/methylation domain-containing protein
VTGGVVMSLKRFSQNRGFTLVELLVVIAIIAILVALLLPAVNAAREAARASQCRNNMKQIALALINFETATRKFPPSSTWPQGTVPESNSNIRLGPNWVILVLPYMEEQSLHSQFKLNQPINDPVNAIPRGATISTLLCPTDSDRNGTRFDGSGNSKTSVSCVSEFARVEKSDVSRGHGSQCWFAGRANQGRH